MYPGTKLLVIRKTFHASTTDIGKQIVDKYGSKLLAIWSWLYIIEFV